MVWWLVEERWPGLATHRSVRWWLRSPFWIRLVASLAFSIFMMAVAAIIPLIAIFVGLFFGLASQGSSMPTGVPKAIVDLIGAVGQLVLIVAGGLSLVPFPMTLVDAFFDFRRMNRILEKFLTKRDVVLTTRAEYIGGHPSLPHSCFLYLFLLGTLQRPYLAFLVPERGRRESFLVPLLDVSKVEPGEEKVTIMAGAVIETVLTQRISHGWQGEKLYFTVDYQSKSGRIQTILLQSFFHGGDEIQQWANYIVCAREEAATGQKPYGPWKSLPEKLA